MDWITFSSNILVAFAWPIAVLLLALAFRADISSLLKRAKSLEIAGTKSEFVDYAAAFGYVESRVSRLAAEPNQEDREGIAAEIKKTSRELQGLHPLAFAFLAEIGRGVSADSAWLEQGRHIIDLKERGYIKIEPDAATPSDIRYADGDHRNNTSASLTSRGDEFLARLGYADRRTYRKNQ